MAPILNGSVQISRSSSSVDGDKIHITIEDEISHCRVLDIYMELDQFARSLTASQGVARIEHYPKSPIGMKAESKTEIVPFRFSIDNKQTSDEVLKPFEVDGWKARRSDLTNHHCRVGDKGQRVVFFRHVNPETGEPV